MKKLIVSAAAIAAMLASANADQYIDQVQWNTGYFVDEASHTGNSPYYRWWDEDWGWQHNAIPTGTTFSSATLSISAWDVDFSSGEIDEIFVKDEGAWVSIGNLAGSNNTYSYTTFTLGAQFYDELESGLEVFMNIDKNHTQDWWAVTLAKSVISLDNAQLPDPNPGVPEPATAGLLILGLASIAAGLKIRRK